MEIEKHLKKCSVFTLRAKTVSENENRSNLKKKKIIG